LIAKENVNNWVLGKVNATKPQLKNCRMRLAAELGVITRENSMGYQVYLQKFENGDSANIPYSELAEILEKYGEIVEGNSGLEFISHVGDICDRVSLSFDVDTGITGITFDRPILHDELPEIIYALLGLNNTCFFGPNLDFVHTRSEMSAHYPEGLTEHLKNGPKKLESSLEAWPST
jgi:hypothetical protein